MLPKCCQAIKNGLDDLPPMTPKRYADAKRKFTPAAVETIRQALNPPADFDLEGRLWRAVHKYHYFSEPDLLSALSPKQQHDAVADVEVKTADLLALLRDQPGVMHDLCDDTFLLCELETCLEHLQARCRERKAKLPKIERGRHPEKGQRLFFLELAKICTEANGKKATRHFNQVCFEVLIGSIGADNLIRMSKEINRLYYKTA